MDNIRIPSLISFTLFMKDNESPSSPPHLKFFINSWLPKIGDNSTLWSRCLSAPSLFHRSSATLSMCNNPPEEHNTLSAAHFRVLVIQRAHINPQINYCHNSSHINQRASSTKLHNITTSHSKSRSPFHKKSRTRSYHPVRVLRVDLATSITWFETRGRQRTNHRAA